MDPVIAANNESGLLQGLYNADKNSDAGPVDYFMYYNSKNAPNMSKTVVAVDPNSTVSANFGGKQLTFRIPKYGLITGLVLRTSITKGATDDSALDSTMIGSRLYSNIQMRTQNNIFFEQTPLACLGKIWDSEPAESVVLSKICQPSVTLAGNGATAIVHTPIMAPYTEKDQHQMRLDALGYEPIEVNCTINAPIAGMGFTDELTAFSAQLWVFYRHLEYNAYQAYRVNNFGPEANVNLMMLVYDTYVDSTPMVTGTTTTTLNIKCPNVAFLTNVAAIDAIAGADAWLDSTTQISSVTFGLSGRNAYQSVPPQVIEYDESLYGKHKLITGFAALTSTTANSITSLANARRFLTLEHNIERNYVNQMGGISLVNTSNPYITVAHTNPGNSTTTLYGQHFIWRILQISPADGRLIIGNAI